MTGPEHYQLAEQMLSEVWESELEPLDNDAELVRRIAAAQVHATLALAAATALIDEKPRGGSFDAYRAWESVAGDAKPEADPLNNIW